MEGRFEFPREELRRRTVRGAAINAVFLVLIDGIVLVQGLIVTRLLGPSDIGLYGIVSVTVMSLLALKRVGIDEAYVQQQEARQEEEFQRAFTLELGLSAAFALAICIAAPILAAVYGESELLAADPGHRLPAARVRAPGAGVGVLPAHGLRAPARAAGDRPGGDLRGHRPARRDRLRRVEPGGRAAGRATSPGAIAAIVVSPYRAVAALRPRAPRGATCAFSGPVFVATAVRRW